MVGGGYQIAVCGFWGSRNGVSVMRSRKNVSSSRWNYGVIGMVETAVAWRDGSGNLGMTRGVVRCDYVRGKVGRDAAGKVGLEALRAEDCGEDEWGGQTLRWFR